MEGVVFLPPSGSEAFAVIEGKTVPMGADWPVEMSMGQSSPAIVVKMLKENDVPYVFNFDLAPKKKTYPKPGEGVPATPYTPSAAPIVPSLPLMRS